MMGRSVFVLIISFLIAGTSHAQQLQITDPVRFLALGDSYTIGQSVPPDARWPNQLADTLQSLGYAIDALDIVAQTGWTTGDLIYALDGDPPSQNYTLVSLLIGVNNQYSGGSLSTYEDEFQELLVKALQYAGSDPSRVFVLSIPDYAYTPFGQDLSDVSEEIDQFNAANEAIAATYGIPYIDITDISRRGLDQPELVAGDGLHPSAVMYELWVDRIIELAGLDLTGYNVPQATEAPEILVYPNPVHDNLIVQFSGQVECTLRRLDGTVMERFSCSGSQGIDVSLLHAGVYILVAEHASGSVFCRFVKL